MDLLDLLPPEHVVVPLRTPDLRAGILALVRRLAEQGRVADLDRLEERVRTDSLRDLVGLDDDVVLPHYRADEVDELSLALGVAREPLVDPETGASARILALILAPPEAGTLYVQTVSTVARLFRQPDVVARVVEQPDAAGVRALPELQALRVQHSLVVRDVMTHRIHSVPPEASVRRTLDLMLRRNLQAVPVVGEGGSVLGVVREADLMRALLPKIPRTEGEAAGPALEPQDRPVRDIMTRSVLCVSEDLGLSEVAATMLNKDMEQVPVVNAGSIAGMVYRRDIIRKLFGRS